MLITDLAFPQPTVHQHEAHSNRRAILRTWREHTPRRRTANHCFSCKYFFLKLHLKVRMHLFIYNQIVLTLISRFSPSRLFSPQWQQRQQETSLWPSSAPGTAGWGRLSSSLPALASSTRTSPSRRAPLSGPTCSLTSRGTTSMSWQTGLCPRWAFWKL